MVDRRRGLELELEDTDGGGNFDLPQGMLCGLRSASKSSKQMEHSCSTNIVVY
jgi:hypothetical protein